MKKQSKKTYHLPPTTYESGFTLIELLVVIFIMALLTALVTTNFQRQREQQEIMAAATDIVSKIREVQSNLLGGKKVAGGQAAEAYQIVLTPGSANYRIDYKAGAATSTLETVNFSRNISLSEIRIGITPANPANVYLRAPFGKITAGGLSNQTIQIDVQHQKSLQVRSIVIDGVSGRIGAQ